MKRLAIHAAALTAVCLGGTALAQQAIAPAPAFTAEQLMTPPTDNWITNGGTIWNQRHSPLDQINRDNVGDLKADWRTVLGSGANPNNSGQAQPIYYDGVIYISTGQNDVFALDADDGSVLWKYEAGTDPRSGVTCCGWSNRGVAIGDGRVYVSHIDAHLAALDMKTGEVIWKIAAQDWRQGYSITAAPLYYDGMVIIGYSGGEMGVRGKVEAFDAATGERVWSFNTVPGPGEFGHDTWPQDSEFWKHGGAPVWQTPAVDPDLDMIYFSTGNPGPDVNGSARAGDNLFSVSILALDAHTGEYKWHFQQVHHDLWDYDSPNPVILFDAEIDGRMRKGVVEVGKTGWAYILDRETGEPLIGIEEKPVPQEPRQATAATQPYPVGDAVVPQYIDAIPEGETLTNEGRIFTPFWTDPVPVKPGTMGGPNWPPSSYDPQTNILYVCATDRISVFRSDGNENMEMPEPNSVFMGGGFGQADAEDRGIFAALDVTTNRLVWRQQWRDICYSGSINTGGGLLFVGRNDGRLTALDEDNGRMLWEFQTDAGVNTAASTFMHDGSQKVVVLAGGAVFAGSKHGSSVWMFSLDGTTDSLPPGAGAVQQAALGGPPRGGMSAAAAAQAAEEHTPDVASGETIYFSGCELCHGETGQGGHGGGAAFTEALTEAEVIAIATAGRNEMPAFGGIYTPQELQDVAAYIVRKLAPGHPAAGD